MSLISRMRRQKAVYWERTGADHHGRGRFKEPVEIDCRWEDNIIDMISPQGEAFNYNSRIYVDREMRIGDILMLGPLESDTPDDPGGDDNTVVIQRFAVTPNPRNTESLYIAYG